LLLKYFNQLESPKKLIFLVLELYFINYLLVNLFMKILDKIKQVIFESVLIFKMKMLSIYYIKC